MRPLADFERGQTQSATKGPAADLHITKESSASFLLKENVDL